MLEVTVKTLDSQNHSFTVPDESTVKEFKSQIAPVLNIAADKQRLIFCGKVLKDDKKLSEYEVNGKVLHVVQSLPPQSNGTTSSNSANSANPPPPGQRPQRDAAGFLLGAFTIPQDLVDPAHVQNIVQDVVSGMGEIGRNATVMSRASDDGSVGVHINLGRVPMQVPLQSEAQLRMNRVQTMLIRANHLLESLEDGANSNNGNVADSSSQTETESEEVHPTPMEAESTSATGPDDAGRTSETPNASGEATPDPLSEITTQIDMSGSMAEFDGFAEAAISAALAMSAAAARHSSAPVSSPATSTTPGTSSTSESEPMDATSAASNPLAFSELPILDPTIIPGSDSPTDSDVTPEPPQTESTATAAAASGSGADSSAHHPSCPLNASSPTTSTMYRRRIRAVRQPGQTPSVQTLANLLDEFIRVNTRLQPWLERTRDVIRKDAAVTGRALGDNHRLFSRVSQLMHFLSHAYHSLSDLHINFSQPPPRSPRVRIISSTHSSSLFQGIPMQAQISISTSNGSPPSTSQPTTTTSSNADTTVNSSSNADSRPVPAPRATAAPSPASSAMPTASSSYSSLYRASNPLVFMEVSPNSLTIDSVRSFYDSSASRLPTTNASSTPNVTTAPATSTTTASSSRDTTAAAATSTPKSSEPASVPPPRTTSESSTAAPPPRTTSESSSAAPPPRTTSAPPPRTTSESSSAAPPPRTTTSTRTSSGSFTAPVSPINPFRNIIPVPLTSMGSLHTFDSGLPCHSVWALEPSRRRHNAGGSRTTTTSGSSPSAAGVTPNLPGRQEDQLQQVINSIMMSLLNATPTPGSPVPAGFTVFASRPDESSGDNNTFMSAISQAAQVARDRAARAESSESSSNASATPRMTPSYPMLYNDTIQLFNTLEMSAMKLSEVIPSGDIRARGILGEILAFISNQLTVRDSVEISFGRHACLDKLQEPLRNFLHEKVFRNSKPLETDISSVVRQIANEMESDLRPFVNSVRPRFGMNYTDGLSLLLRSNIRRVIDVVLDRSETSESYGSRLLLVTQDICRQFMSLNSTHAFNANSIVEATVRSYVDPLTANISRRYCTAVRSWLMVCICKFMSKFVPRRPASESNSQNNTAAGSTSRSPNGSTMGQRRPNEMRSNSSERSGISFSSPNVRRLIIEGLGGVTDAVSGASIPLSSFSRTAEATAALFRNTSRPNESRQTNHSFSDVVIGSDSWHNAVPRQWVPFIDRDMQRQRRQAPQAPFSDAYLSGMPSKRRKIMTNGSPALLESSQSAFSEMLLQAVASADVRPQTSMTEVKADASQDAPLQASFTDHMKQAIQERLQRDLDYCSERFPNSEKYFN